MSDRVAPSARRAAAAELAFPIRARAATAVEPEIAKAAGDVCHTCDNPPCCNPAHLFLGTYADNNADRHAKGRTVMPDNGPDFWRAKTHCPQGHPYDGENVRFREDGRRRCATCYRERAAARLAANRDQINARRRAHRAARRSA